MDVNEFPAFSHTSMSLDHLVEDNYKTDKSNFSLPNYDQYTVTSQGLSGNITPTSYKELNLVDRGRSAQNDDKIYTGYIADNFDGWLDRYYDLGGYTHFYFENEFNSFLRIDKTNILRNNTIVGTVANDFTALRGFQSNTTNTYSEDFTPNGEQLKNGNRKRTGNYIETFTYKDGKTYHYSLPVYNFELFYKNFKQQYNQNQNFFEIQKTKPYATHWLLTAITGPDYIDTNADGKVNKEDYGYWIEFNYGKWSVGYVWKGPTDGLEEHINSKDPNNKVYSYYWGRKQIYYLDAIKTRTHTALFIKDLRLDNQSSISPNTYKETYSSGEFDVIKYSKKYTSEGKNWNKKTFGKPRDTMYGPKNELVKLTWYQHQGDTVMRQDWRGDKSSYKYINIPKSKVLKLSKILIVKNDVTWQKDRGNLSSSIWGHMSLNNGHCSYYKRS